MPLRTAEAFILRTWPLRESDKIVSFFAREWGKCRGVARAARRPRSRFGSLLEPLTQVRLQFFEREGKDLSTIDGGELIASMALTAGTSLLPSLALGCVAEVAERMLPEREANDAVFRLLVLVLGEMRGTMAAPAPDAVLWRGLSFYLFWMVRLGGFLPSIEDLPAAPRGLAAALASAPLPDLDPATLELAAGSAGRELRAFLRRQIEDHLEARLHSWPLLTSLERPA